VAAVRIVSAPLWGRAVDRLGARPVLVLCSFGIASVPAIWLFVTPAFLWPLALEAALAGALWGGHSIAAMDLTVKLSPGPERPFYLAMFAAASGLGFAVAAALAGLLASHLPARFELLGETWTNLHVLFLLLRARATRRRRARAADPGVRRAGRPDVRQDGRSPPRRRPSSRDASPPDPNCPSRAPS
jgi:MFS family permease